MDIPDLAELWCGCEDVGVRVDSDIRAGRFLRAERDFGPYEKILKAPCEHSVVIPAPSKQSDLQQSEQFLQSASSGLERFQRREAFAFVEAACAAEQALFTPRIYWAALMSLCAEQGPTCADWPTISPQTQARLLLLYRPEQLCSTLCGRYCEAEVELGAGYPRSVDGTARETESGIACGRSTRSFDSVVRLLCEHFALRINRDALEQLVMVWKFNSFISIECGACKRERNAETSISEIDDPRDLDYPVEVELSVFLAVSLCNHSCAPNCKLLINESGFAEIVTMTEGLAVGEEATISYLSDGDAELCTQARMEMIAYSFLFCCRCPRCSEMAMPMCEQCKNARMSFILTNLEETVYPGHNVDCDRCGETDMHDRFSCFFHCFDCEFDLCAKCGFDATASSN